MEVMVPKLSHHQAKHPQFLELFLYDVGLKLLTAQVALLCTNLGSPHSCW